MEVEVKDYLDNKYTIPEELVVYFNELNDKSVNFDADLSENYSSAFELSTFFNQWKTT